MDYENLTPQYRIEEYLEAIVEGWAEATQYPYPDYPSWRLEEFLDAFITYIWEDGDHPRHPCPEPAWRLEECLRAIYDVMTGAATPWPFPLPTTNRIEEYLAAIHAYLADGTELPVPEPVWRIEQWLAYVLDAVKQGGGVETTVSGTMVHITNALAKAALSVLVNIEPIQDLHGYSHPWPAGGGRNKCVPDLANGQIGSKGGYSSSTSRLTNAVRVDNAYVSNTYLSAGTYTLSVDGLTQCTVLTKDASANIIDNFATAWHNLPYTFTMTAAGYVLFTGRKSAGDLNPDDYKAQIESGSTATAWAPYSNICPISGRTGLSVYRTGVNVWDEVWELGGINGSGNNQSGTDRIRSKNYIPVTPGATYYFYINSTYGIYAWGYDSSKTYVGRVPSNGWAISNNTVTIPSGVYYIRIVVQPGYGTTYNNDISINYPSTDTDYHAYQGTTYTVDWTSEAGTVYGGTLDIVTGVLTVDRASISSYAGETLPGAWISDRDVYAPGTSPTTGAQVVYELATPLTYQLSAQEVQMLLGENYVWSSSGDTVSVTYYAEGNANPLQSLNILLGGNYSNPKTADDVSDKEALEIILGGNK